MSKLPKKPATETTNPSRQSTSRITAVYIETSILDPIPITLADAEFQRLAELGKTLRIPLIVTRLTVEEFTEHRRRKLRKTIIGIKEHLEKLAELTGFAPKIVWPDETVLMANLELAINRNFKSAGLEIIEDLEVDQRRLKEMAIRGIAPFSEKTGDKGMKDAIIVFTILDHVRRGGIKGRPLIICGDHSASAAVRELPEAVGLNPILSQTIREAIHDLERFLGQALLNEHKRLLSKLRAFLIAHRLQIENLVQNMGPIAIMTHDELGEEVLDLDMGRNLESVEVVDIQEPILGVLPGEKVGGKVDISFIARTRFTSQPMLPAIRNPLVYVLRGSPEPKMEERIPVRRVAVNPILITGSVQLDERDQFSELALNRARSGVIPRLLDRSKSTTESDELAGKGD